MLASGGDDARIILWDAKKGELGRGVQLRAAHRAQALLQAGALQLKPLLENDVLDLILRFAQGALCSERHIDPATRLTELKGHR